MRGLDSLPDEEHFRVVRMIDEPSMYGATVRIRGSRIFAVFRFTLLSINSPALMRVFAYVRRLRPGLFSSGVR
jgi:hypothetical protein